MHGSYHPIYNNGLNQEEDDGEILQQENIHRARATGFSGINLRPTRLQISQDWVGHSPAVADDREESK